VILWVLVASLTHVENAKAAKLAFSSTA
jgi:hypothetical protein